MFYKEIFGATGTVWVPLALLILTVIAAHATYIYLEAPVRAKSAARPKRVAAALVSLQGVLMLLAFFAWRDVIPERLTNLRSFSDATQDWLNIDPKTVLKGKKEGKVLFFGDSYVEQLYPRYLKTSQERGGDHKDLVFFTYPGCAVMPKLNRQSRLSCLPFVEEGFRLAHEPDVTNVIIGSSWQGFLTRGDHFTEVQGREVPIDPNAPEANFVFDAFEAQLGSLIKSGKVVHLILTPPGDDKADPARLAKAQMPSERYMTVAEHRQRVGKINERLAGIARRVGAVIVDPEDWLCKSGICSFVDPEGRPIFKDPTHLRASFVRDKLTVLDQFSEN